MKNLTKIILWIIGLASIVSVVYLISTDTQKSVIVSSKTDLFKYIKKVENTKLLQNNFAIEAWEVDVNTDLITDRNVKQVRINLFDGNVYEVVRNDEQMKDSTCDSSQCEWNGNIKDTYCGTKNTAAGVCPASPTVTFILNGGVIVGNIPAFLGVNPYSYSVGPMANTPGLFLIKIDPSRFGND